MALRGILWRKIQEKRIKLKKKKEKMPERPAPPGLSEPQKEMLAPQIPLATKIRSAVYRGGHLLYPASKLPLSNRGELLITDKEMIFQKKNLFRRKDQWSMVMPLKRIDFKEMEMKLGPNFYTIPFTDNAGVKQSPVFHVGKTKEAKKLGEFIHQKIASTKKNR